MVLNIPKEIKPETRENKVNKSDIVEINTLCQDKTDRSLTASHVTLDYIGHVTKWIPDSAQMRQTGDFKNIF